jgi:hypothetical protein
MISNILSRLSVMHLFIATFTGVSMKHVGGNASDAVLLPIAG